MSRHARSSAGGTVLRFAILALLAAGPLLAGAVHEPVFIPLLCGCAVAGATAWFRSRRDTRHGLAPSEMPGWRLLAALHVVVVFQLVPFPLPLLRVLSPGSHAFYSHVLLDPTGAWRPISVSPPDTLRGLAFLAGFSLLAYAVFREMTGRLWRGRLLRTVVGVGVVITVVALVQSVSPEPRRIYGLWRPRWDWAVFGPYVNGSHFAGYLLMATPLAMGFALEAITRLREAWRRRRLGFLALGDAAGNSAIRAGAVVVVLAAGIVAAGSRGATGALLALALTLPVVSHRRRRAALAGAGLVALGVAWIGLGGFWHAFESRGIRHSRFDLWLDMLPMVARFPLFGTGLNAFATAYPAYQHVERVGADWIGEAHNEYFQAVLDTGLVGASLFAGLLLLVYRRAFAHAAQGALDLGVLGALLGLSFHNMVDFNWQIPANAATWIALAALACRQRTSDDPDRRGV